jgi:hypothetical protein
MKPAFSLPERKKVDDWVSGVGEGAPAAPKAKPDYRPAARAQRRHGDRRCVVDLDRQRGDLQRHLHEFIEILLPDVAAADTVAGNPRLDRLARSTAELLRIAEVIVERRTTVA